jgi:hypothetical protein
VPSRLSPSPMGSITFVTINDFKTPSR